MASLEKRIECATHQRPPLGLDHVLAHERLDELLHVVVVQHRQRTETRVRDHVAQALGVILLLQPIAGHARAADLTEFRVHHIVGEKVLLDERAEAVADLIFLVRDEIGVRDRQTERPSEQCRDREPVGERADHAALAGGAHVAEPRIVLLQGETDDEDCGHREQQPERQTLHLAQLPEPVEIVGSDRPEGAFARFHHLSIMPLRGGCVPHTMRRLGASRCMGSRPLPKRMGRRCCLRAAEATPTAHLLEGCCERATHCRVARGPAHETICLCTCSRN